MSRESDDNLSSINSQYTDLYQETVKRFTRSSLSPDMERYSPSRNSVKSLRSDGDYRSPFDLYLEATGRRRSSDHGAVLTHDTEQFIIGQKVWVGGIRPGQIAYIGETHFAPGDWAGVVLDEPNGKNDGCVAGKRYFQCEPKRGIFSRLTRLTLVPLASAPHTPTSPLSKFSPDRSRTVSPTASIRSSFLRSPGKNGLTVGDRVIVSSGFGSRPGILRYLGETQFASGNWCGIELDEATGKNDGAVDGIRYFECKPKYGVFVPIAKVSLSPSSKKSRLSRTGSRESLNSIGTMNSIATTNTSRLRMNAQRKPLSIKPVAATPKSQYSMQDLLHEKQKHIEQLMIERDLDREDSQNQALQYQKSINELKTRITQLERALDDERKKSEDLQFSIDEATYCGDGLNPDTQIYKKKIQDLEQKLATAIIEKEQLTLVTANIHEANIAAAVTAAHAEANKKIAELMIQQKQQASEYETRLAAVQEEEKRLQENIQYLQVESETLQKELVEKDQSLEKFSLSECGIDNLRRELELLKEESEKERQQLHAEYKIKLQEKEASLKSLHGELGIEKNSLATLESDRANLEDECEILRSEFKTRDQQLQDANEQLAKLKAEMSMQKAENATLEELLKAQQASSIEGKTALEQKVIENGKLNEEINSLNNTKKTLENNLKIASEELKKLSETQKGFEEKMKLMLSADEEKASATLQLEIFMEELKKRISDTSVENEKLQVEIKKQTETCNATKTAEEELRLKLTELEKLHRATDEELKSANTLSAKYESELSTLQQDSAKSLSAKIQEVEALNAETGRLQKQVKSLESNSSASMQQMSARNSELEVQIKNLQSQLQQQESALKEKTQEHAEQKQQLAEKTEDLNSTRAILESTTNLVNKLKQEQDHSVSRYNELEVNLKKHEEQCGQQQLEIGDLTRKQEALNEKCVNLSAQNDGLEQDLKSARTMATEFQNELRRINEELNTKQKTYMELQSNTNDERLKFESQIEEMQLKLANATKDITELQLNVKQSKDELSKKNEQMSTLEEKTIKQELSLSDAQRQQENLLAKHDALTAQNKSLQDDLTALRTSSTDSNAELLKMSQDVAAKQKAYEELLDRSNAERVALESQLQAGQQRIDTLCSQVEALTQELKNTTEESLKRFDALKQEQEKSDKQDLELNDLARKLEALTTKCTSLESDNENLQKDLSALRAASTDSSATAAKLNEELTKKQKALQEYTDKASAERLQADKQLQELNQRLESAQQELEGLRVELQASNEAKSTQVKEFEALKNELQAQATRQLDEVKTCEEKERKTLIEKFEAQLKTAENTKITLDEAISSLQQQIKLLQDELMKSQLDFKSKEEEMRKQIDGFVSEGEKLRQTLQQLQTEGTNTLSSAQQEKLELLQRLEQLQTELKAKDTEVSTQKSEVEQLKIAQKNANADANKLQEEIKSLQNALELANAEVAHRLKIAEEDKRKMDELRNMIEAAQVINANISSTNAELSDALQSLEQEKCETSNIFELFEMEADQNMEKLAEKLSEIKQQLQDAQAQLQESNTTLMNKEVACETANAKYEASQNALIAVQSTLMEQTEQLNALSMANAELRQALAEKESLAQQRNEVETQLAEYKKVVDELDDASMAKSTQMQTLQQRIVQLEQEQVQAVEAQKAQKLEYAAAQRKMEQLELEKTREIVALQARIKDLQAIRQLKHNGANELTDETNEDSTAQINFLNSIIADMQRKNDTLKAKIEALEALPTDYTQPKAFELLTKRKPAPRVFCDICDEFDKHETEDCPLQASDDRDYSPPPMDPANKKERKLPPPRKYCESCEVFGHEAGECDNDECY